MAKESLGQLSIGVPSKGVLNEGSNKFLRMAGLNYQRDPKRYVAESDFYEQYTGLSEDPIDVIGSVKLAFMRPSDIVKRVASGDLDLGIAGGDTVEELGLNVKTLRYLDYGYCDLVLATTPDFKKAYVEEAKDPWSIAAFMSTLSKMRIGTSYPNIAEKTYSRYGLKPEVFQIDGASEGLIELGWANAVMDITETGNALRENGLVVFDVVRKYQAELIAGEKITQILRQDTFKGSDRFARLLVDELRETDRWMSSQRRKEPGFNNQAKKGYDEVNFRPSLYPTVS